MQVRLLDERERPRLRARRHRRGRRRQEPEGDRRQVRRARRPKAADAAAWPAVRRQALATIMDEKNVTAPAQGRPLGLRHQRPDEHHQRDGRAAGQEQPGDRRSGSAPRRSAASSSTITTWSTTRPATPARSPARRKSRSRTARTPASAWRASSTSRPGRSAPTATWTTSATVAKLIDQCNDYGMDTIELGNVFATYMEATERGWVTDYDGLAWGDAAKMVELTPQDRHPRGHRRRAGRGHGRRRPTTTATPRSR